MSDDNHNQVAQSVEHQTLEVEVQGSKSTLGTWWWGWISPNQPYPKGAARVASTPLNEWWLQISLYRINTVSKKKQTKKHCEVKVYHNVEQQFSLIKDKKQERGRLFQILAGQISLVIHSRINSDLPILFPAEKNS